MYIILKGSVEITIVAAYMPPADRPTEEKETAYNQLQQIVDRRKNKGPVYIIGDWNARLIYPNTDEEHAIMGKHTLHENAEWLGRHTEGMKEHRDMMIEFCITNELMVTNTMYRKTPNKISTYRKHKETDIEHEEPITRDTHEQCSNDKKEII